MSVKKNRSANDPGRLGFPGSLLIRKNKSPRCGYTSDCKTREQGLLSDQQYRFLILRHGCVAGEQHHPFRTGLSNQ